MFSVYLRVFHRALHKQVVESRLNVMEKYSVVSLGELQKFIVRCMESVNTDRAHAESLADVLVAGDYRGHYSHGLNRLKMYIEDVSTKTCKGAGSPKILKETVATGLVDGCNLLGPVIGNFCMDLAIQKAKNVGLGMVVAKDSNHYGIAGWYAIRAQQQGLIGLSFTNTSPIVATTRGIKPVVGTNPISFAAPAKNGDSFVLDMATSAVALGKVEMQERKEETVPLGWGINKVGKSVTDPTEILKEGALLPLGGEEHTSGYKGYGLGVMVDILCGILSGSSYGPHIRSWKDTSTEANLGQCFMAIDPSAFELGFESRLSELIGEYRHQEPADKDKPVLIAGDPERQHMRHCDVIGGIPYHPNQIDFIHQISRECSVEPPVILSRIKSL